MTKEEIFEVVKESAVFQKYGISKEEMNQLTFGGKTDYKFVELLKEVINRDINNASFNTIIHNVFNL